MGRRRGNRCRRRSRVARTRRPLLVVVALVRFAVVVVVVFSFCRGVLAVGIRRWRLGVGGAGFWVWNGFGFGFGF